MKRRTFLKLSGLVGLCVLGPRFTFGSTTIRPSLSFDPRKCLGCLACVTACQRPTDPRETDRLYLTPEEAGRYPGVRLHFRLTYCLQCQEAPCISACPHQALRKTEEGIVILDQERCRGEGLCARACPHQALEVSFGRAFKCDLCFEELKEGLLPRCAAVCPTGALEFSPSELFVPQKPPKPATQERLVHTVCLACNTRCGLRVRVKEDEIIRVDGNPYHPYNRRGRALPYETPLKEALKASASTCAKPQMDQDYLHNPYRILKPLKRCGERGSGKFEPISWEQLIREIAEGGKLFAHLGDERYYPGLKDFLSDAPLDPASPELGPERNRVVWLTGRSQAGRKHFIRRFVCQAVGSINHIPHTDICGIGFRMGNFILSDGEAVEFKADPEKARYILVFGSNFFSALQPGPNAYASRLVERVKKGELKYVLIDPRGHEALAHAHRWLPVRPGKDGALALALLRIFLEDNTFDKEFLEIPSLETAKKKGRNSFTNATHLVIVSTEEEAGRFLTTGDIGLAGEDYLVVDEQGKPLPASKALRGTLDWEGEIAGFRVKTAFRLFKEAVFAHSLEFYAEEAGIPLETIRKVAEEFASHAPYAVAFAYHGGGNYVGGAYASYAIALLNALFGNINREGGYLAPGGSPASWQKGIYDLKSFPGARKPSGVPISREKASYEKTREYQRRGYPAKLPWFPFTKGGLTVSALAGIDQAYPYHIGILFTYFFNPVYSIPGGRRFIETLKDQNKVPLHVSIDVTINESNLYADYIVPDVTYLEGHYGFLTPHAPGENFVGVRTPVVEPLTGRTGDGRPYCLETFLIDLACFCKLPGFGKEAIPHRTGKLLPLRQAEDFFLRGMANLAENAGLPKASPEEKRYVEENYPVARNRTILTPEEWERVVTLLARGGVFRPWKEAFDPRGNLKKGIPQIHFWNERLARSRNSLNGERFHGTVTYARAREAFGRLIEEEDRDFPFVLVSHKHALHTQSRTICYEKALHLLPEPHLMINQKDAEKLGLKEGEIVVVSSRSFPEGIMVRVKPTERIRPGCAALCHHYGHTQHGARSLVVFRGEEVFLGGKRVMAGEKLIPDLRRAAGAAVNLLSRLDESLYKLPLVDLVGGIPDFSNTRVTIRKFT